MHEDSIATRTASSDALDRADHPNVITRFDGNTGELKVAIEYSGGGGGLGRVIPTDIAGGSMWLHGEGSRNLDALPIGRLDAQTLQPDLGA